MGPSERLFKPCHLRRYWKMILFKFFFFYFPLPSNHKRRCGLSGAPYDVFPTICSPSCAPYNVLSTVWSPTWCHVSLQATKQFSQLTTGWSLATMSQKKSFLIISWVSYFVTAMQCCLMGHGKGSKNWHLSTHTDLVQTVVGTVQSQPS